MDLGFNDCLSWLTIQQYGQLAIYLPSVHDGSCDVKLDQAKVTLQEGALQLHPTKQLIVPIVTSIPFRTSIVEKSIENIEEEEVMGSFENSDNAPKPVKCQSEQKTVCYECGKLIKNKHYVKHQQSHMYKCKYCHEMFGSEGKLLTHSKVHEQNGDECSKYVCETCSVKFSNPIAYAFHCEKHTGFGVFKCPMCEFQTTSKCSIKPHIKRFHQQDFKVICEICGKGFLNMATHAEHMILHAGDKKYQCEYCDKKFVILRYLNIHKTLNHRDIIEGVNEVYNCQVCSREFKFQKSLVRHLSCIHNIGEDRRVNCPICKKVIANNYGLKMHMRRHTGEKPYNCNHCDLTFSKTKYLKCHEKRVHPDLENVKDS